MNTGNVEVMLIGKADNTSLALIQIDGMTACFSNSVKNMGVTLDLMLFLKTQIKGKARNAFYYLY